MNNGILLIDKPMGFTSNQIVQKVRKALNGVKAGHTGSLDPLATGMLPVCINEGTKVCQYLLDEDKCYEVVGQLGLLTTTGDRLGEPLSLNSDEIKEKEFLAILPRFSGVIQQTPPMYSALKHQGKPLYDYARKGIVIDRPARTITIHRLEVCSYQYPFFSLRVYCSKGTYIRSLVEDIGQSLGVGACVHALRRVYTAGFESEKMYPLSDWLELDLEKRWQTLLPMTMALSHYRRCDVSEDQARALQQGKVLFDFSPRRQESEDVQLYAVGSFIGIGIIGVTGELKVKRLLNVNFLS